MVNTELNKNYIENSFRILGIVDEKRIQENKESDVFDIYGNYKFPTETNFSGQNSLMPITSLN